MANGKLKLGTDVVLVENGQYLAPLAARYWRLMKAAALRDGVNLSINEGYRTYARQVYYRTLYLAGLGNPAGIPGTSKHGLGLAVDVHLFAGVFDWLTVNGPRFGFTWTQGRQDDEKWHWVFEGVTRPASIPNETITEEDETPMFLMTISDGRGTYGPKNQTYRGLFGPDYFMPIFTQATADALSIRFGNAKAAVGSYEDWQAALTASGLTVDAWKALLAA